MLACTADFSHFMEAIRLCLKLNKLYVHSNKSRVYLINKLPTYIGYMFLSVLRPSSGVSTQEHTYKNLDTYVLVPYTHFAVLKWFRMA